MPFTKGHPFYPFHNPKERGRRISEAKKGKPNGLKGRKYPTTHRQNISKGRIGIKFSEEHIRHMSEVRRGKPNLKLRGRKATEEQRKRMSEIHFKNPQRYWLGKKRLHMTGTNHFMYGKHHTEESLKKIRLARLNQVVPFRDTSIERKVQDELANREIGFYKHFPIFGQPDIAFPDKKIAVFCDGDYWHNIPKQIERSKVVNERLRSEGWLVLRYWEHEINNNTESIIDEIEEVFCANR